METIQCKANITNTSQGMFIAHKTKRNKQLNRIGWGLFWNYVNWNSRYVEVLMVWIFLHLFYTAKLHVQTAWLHHLSAMQRLRLENNLSTLVKINVTMEMVQESYYGSAKNTQRYEYSSIKILLRMSIIFHLSTIITWLRYKKQHIQSQLK